MGRQITLCFVHLHCRGKVDDDITTFLEKAFPDSDEFGLVTRDVLLQRFKRDFINSPLNQPRSDILIRIHILMYITCPLMLDFQQLCILMICLCRPARSQRSRNTSGQGKTDPKATSQAKKKRKKRVSDLIPRLVYIVLQT